MCDLVARFAFFYRDLGGDPPKACKPRIRFLRPRPSRKKEGEFELSSSRIESDNDHDIEQEGRVALSRNKGKDVDKLVGWVKLSKEDVGSSGVQLDPDDDPPGHVHIVGWPTEPEDQDQIIQSLIRKCCCKKLDEPITRHQL